MILPVPARLIPETHRRLQGDWTGSANHRLLKGEGPPGKVAPQLRAVTVLEASSPYGSRCSRPEPPFQLRRVAMVRPSCGDRPAGASIRRCNGWAGTKQRRVCLEQGARVPGDLGR